VLKKEYEISVVMSVYNGAKYLRESIVSILKQEGVHFEFIIVNDGSTDKSDKILDEYAKRDSSVRVIHQKNQGLTMALIKGCSIAKGKYIARQDVGDVSLPSRLMLQKKALDADKEIAFVSCWTEYCGPEFESLFLAKGSGRSTIPSNIISEDENQGVIDGPNHHGSVMFRKNSYIQAGGYREEFYYGQDWDLWYRLAEIGRFQMIDKVLYKARVSPGSISACCKKKQDSIAKLSFAAMLQRRKGLSEQSILDKASTIRPDKNNNSSAKNMSAWLYFIGECLRRNSDKRAISYFKKSLSANPFFIKSWIRIIQALILLR
jgi:glycosyltransferase involved in cell wall biosynthesis